MGTRCADHATPLYPQNLAVTSPTGGGRSVGIVRSRTKATEFRVYGPGFETSYVLSVVHSNNGKRSPPYVWKTSYSRVNVIQKSIFLFEICSWVYRNVGPKRVAQEVMQSYYIHILHEIKDADRQTRTEIVNLMLNETDYLRCWYGERRTQMWKVTWKQVQLLHLGTGTAIRNSRGSARPLVR